MVLTNQSWNAIHFFQHKELLIDKNKQIWNVSV